MSSERKLDMQIGLLYIAGSTAAALIILAAAIAATLVHNPGAPLSEVLSQTLAGLF